MEDDLIRGLDSPDEAERIYSAQDIAETHNPELAVHLYERLLSETSQAVRDAIVFSLKHLSCIQIYPLLFKLFRSPDPYLRNAAISIFGSEKTEVIPFLTSHMNHADAEVRKLILDALFATGHEQAVPAIRQGVSDTSVNVQITAVEYLGRLRDRQSIDRLIQIFQTETEPMLRIAILESFSFMGNETDISKILALLLPETEGIRPDILCLPQIIRLAAKIGDTERLSRITEIIPDIEMYAEDIIRAVDEAYDVFKEKEAEDAVLEIIKGLMINIHEESLYALCEALLRKKRTDT